MEIESIQGVWWNPEEIEIDRDDVIPSPGLPEGVVPGEARFEPTTGGELELIGGFNNQEPYQHIQEDYEMANTSVIFGISIDGELITICDCIESNRSHSHSQVIGSSQTWYFGQLLKGTHQRDPKTDEISLQISGLEKWATFDFDRSLEIKSIEEFRETREDTANINGDIIKIRGSRDLFPSGSLGSDTATFILEFQDRISVKDIIADHIVVLQNFMTLAMGKPTYPRSITADSSNFENRYDVYYHMQSYEKDVDYGIPVFGYSNIEFEKILKNWYTIAMDLPEVMTLFFGTQYNKPDLEHLEFLSLIISLEVIHRRRFPSKQKLMDKSNFREYREEIVENIPDIPPKDRISKLIQSIGNEPSLRDRLEDLVIPFDKELGKIIDVDELVDEAVDKRHSLAHGLRAVHSSDLVQLNRSLRLIVCMLLFDELGFKEDELLVNALNYLPGGPVYRSSD